MAQQQHRQKLTPGHVVREYAEALGVALVIALIIKTFVLQAFSIPSGSMRYTLMEHDHILVNRLAYEGRSPQRGDIVVFKTRGVPLLSTSAAEEGKKYFIKRIVGLPGESLRIDMHGRLWDGDTPIETPWRDALDGGYAPAGSFAALREFDIPEGQYFLLGDNTTSSHDSRFWGTVCEEHIIGKALFLYWPISRWRMFDTPEHEQGSS